MGRGGWYDGGEVFSLRTINPDAKLGVIVRKILYDLGTSGGHGMTAGGQIRPMAADENSQRELEQLIVQRFLKTLEMEPTPGKPLVSDVS